MEYNHTHTHIHIRANTIKKYGRGYLIIYASHIASSYLADAGVDMRQLEGGMR